MTYYCSICDYYNNMPGTEVPQRTDSELPPFEAVIHTMCLVCLDSFLDIFPLTPQKILHRQITGRGFRHRPFENVQLRRRLQHSDSSFQRHVGTSQR